MGMDRFITWGEPPDHGAPRFDKIAQVLQDFLGPRWKVRATHSTWLVAECDDPQTFALRSEYVGWAEEYLRGWDDGHDTARSFEVFFPKDLAETTSVITRFDDEFTRALADQFAKLIARWWNGEVEWPS